MSSRCFQYIEFCDAEHNIIQISTCPSYRIVKQVNTLEVYKFTCQGSWKCKRKRWKLHAMFFNQS